MKAILFLLLCITSAKCAPQVTIGQSILDSMRVDGVGRVTELLEADASTVSPPTEVATGAAEPIFPVSVETVVPKIETDTEENAVGEDTTTIEVIVAEVSKGPEAPLDVLPNSEGNELTGTLEPTLNEADAVPESQSVAIETSNLSTDSNTIVTVNTEETSTAKVGVLRTREGLDVAEDNFNVQEDFAANAIKIQDVGAVEEASVLSNSETLGRDVASGNLETDSRKDEALRVGNLPSTDNEQGGISVSGEFLEITTESSILNEDITTIAEEVTTVSETPSSTTSEQSVFESEKLTIAINSEVVSTTLRAPSQSNSLPSPTLKETNIAVETSRLLELTKSEDVTSSKPEDSTTKSSSSFGKSLDSITNVSPSLELEKSSSISAPEVGQLLSSDSEVAASNDVQDSVPLAVFIPSPEPQPSKSVSEIVDANSPLPTVLETAPQSNFIPIVMDERDPIIGNAYGFRYRSGDGQFRSEKSLLRPLQPGAAAADPSAAPDYEVVGEYSFTHPDGTLHTVSYSAGLNGFVATGNMLPTPPPMPLWAKQQIEFAEEQKRLLATTSSGNS